MHGPCGDHNPTNVCMQDGHCKNNFPKPFRDATEVGDDSYALYRRRNNGLKVKKIIRVNNIPREVNQLSSDLRKLPYGTKIGKNSWGERKYGGPCPPDKEHRYFFKLYALDSILNLDDGATKQQIKSAMKSHVISEAQLIGKYDSVNRRNNQKLQNVTNTKIGIVKFLSNGR